MRWWELNEKAEQLTAEQVCEIIADDDALWSAVAGYVSNFESGLAANDMQRARFVELLSRIKPFVPYCNLWRGECRQDWKEEFGRGFHSWSGSLKTATWFKNDCAYRGGGLLLHLGDKPIRAIPLELLITMRMRVRDESHYASQAEWFVFDADALKYGYEIDQDKAQRIVNTPRPYTPPAR